MSGELFMVFGGMDEAVVSENRYGNERMQAGNDHVAITGRLEGGSWTDAAFRTDYEGVLQANNRTQEHGESQLHLAQRLDTCKVLGQDTVAFATNQCSQLLV